MATDITTQNISITSLTTEVAVLKEQIKGLRELIVQQDKSVEKALELQAREYERRLDDLNHAHKQAVETQATFVSREVYDAYVASQLAAADLERRDKQKWRDEVQQELASSRGATLAQQRTVTIIVSVGGLLLAGTIFFLNYIIK